MPSSLKLIDFLDEEVLALVVDLGDDEGWVSSAEFAEAVGLTTQNVGSRFTWLKRYGVLERDTRSGVPTKGFWRLTELGDLVVKARFNKSQETALSSIKDEQLLLVMESIADQYEAANAVVANLMRRRFSVSTYRRR